MNDVQTPPAPHWSDSITDEEAAEAERRFLEWIARRDAEEAAEAELRADAQDLLF
jgi:hypothetical protein